MVLALQGTAVRSAQKMKHLISLRAAPMPRIETVPPPQLKVLAVHSETTSFIGLRA